MCHRCRVVQKSRIPNALGARAKSECCVCRVEEGRGSKPLDQPRFPSPLIKPDVRISRIRLSDWFHREHTAGGRHERHPWPRFALAARYSFLGRVRTFSGVSRLTANHPDLAIFESAPEVRILPSPGVTRLQRYYDPVRSPSVPPPVSVVEAATLAQDGSPPLPASPFRRAVPNTPADRTGAFIDFFPIRAAFPVLQAGRHPHLYFRGLLRLHSRYGPSDRSTAQGGLRHEASIQPVTRPNRSSATRAIDNSLDGSFLHW
jgi:hypothetical protein